MPIVIMIIIIIEIMIILFLLGYNVHTNRNLEQAKKTKESFSRILVLRDIMNISASNKSSKDKMNELNNILIEKMNVDYSTIVYYNGLEYIIKATNIENIGIDNNAKDILNIQNLEVFKESLVNKEFKYITTDKEEEQLPYLESRKNEIKSVIFYPIISRKKYLGYWLIESKKRKAFENVDIQILENLKQSIRNTVEVLSYEEALETMVRDDKFSELKSMEYLQTEGKILLEKHIRPQIVMFRIDNLEKINEEFSRQAGNVVITEVTKKILNITKGDNIFIRYMGPKFIIVFEDGENTENQQNNQQNEKEYIIMLKNIKEAVENIRLVQTEQGVFRKEHLDMIRNASSQDDEDMIDELDDLDILEKVEEDDENEEIEIESETETEKESEIENEQEQEKRDTEELYIIPKLNIVLKEYDKGNLENICRKLEEYLDADENRGKSEIVIL